MVAMLAALAVNGCAYAADEEVADEDTAEDVGETEQELIWGGIGLESPTTLTFYENADYSGAAYTVQVNAAAPETLRLVPKTEIEAAGMLNRIQSVRLSCGTRAADTTLFGAWNTGTSLATWSPYSDGPFLSCAAGQVDQISLPYEWPELAGKVASAYFVNHANKVTIALFSSVVASNWNAALQNLPSGASAVGGPIFQLEGPTSFTLRQNLKLDDWKCGDRSAHMILRAFMQQDRTFNVIVATTYVHTGWGDSWGCRTKMKNALDSAAVTAAQDLDAGLESLAQLVGTHPRYYFVLYGDLSDFDIAGGGASSEPVLTSKF
jgi:hypothetical protein